MLLITSFSRMVIDHVPHHVKKLVSFSHAAETEHINRPLNQGNAKYRLKDPI